MLSDFSQNAWHVQGFPRKDISVGVEEVDERAFLFRGTCGASVHRFAFGATRVYEDLLGTLPQLKRPGRPLGVRRFFDDLLPDRHKLFGGNNFHDIFAALDCTPVGALEGGADGDGSTWTRHLQLQIGVVGDDHELRIAWMSQDGMVGPWNPTTS